jgi:hypothetical protein
LSKLHKNIPGYFFLFLTLFSFSSSAQDFRSQDQWNRSLEGKIIRNINIRTLNVAESFDDEEGYPDTSLADGSFKNLTNSVHYKTRNWVVSERLLFKEGDKLNFRDLYESERLLRSTNLFLEVRVRVYRAPKNKVDVNVITKDRWTLTYLASYKPGDKSGYLGLRDNNFIGLGHTAGAEINYNNDPAVGLGGKINYTVANIKGSYTDLKLNFEANKKYDIKSITLTRPFITYETEWIAGTELRWERNTLEILDQNNELKSLPLKKSFQDLWVGRAFPVNIANGFNRSNSNLITSLRIISLNHSERPYNPPEYRIFENSTMLLFGIGLVSRSFYKDKFVQEFGTTEDIPIGTGFSLSTGPEKRELNNRWYTILIYINGKSGDIGCL